MSSKQFRELSREVDYLGRVCGDVIRAMSGEAGFELVEQVRGLVREMHAGNDEATAELHELLSSLDEKQILQVTKSFTVFLELSNVAEDRQRVRVLRTRAREAYPEPPSETIRDAFSHFHREGMSSSEVQGFVDRARIELVLTAHPTEAKRRSVRSLLLEIRDLLAALDANQLIPTEVDRVRSVLAAQVLKLWQTDFMRPWRPSVLEEVERGLAIKAVLWEEVPKVVQDLRDARDSAYPKVKMNATPVIQYGSWIGGDRDGNPFVTPEVTQQTLEWLRKSAIQSHQETCAKVSRALTLSDTPGNEPKKIHEAIARAVKTWPHLEEILSQVPVLESYRRWLRVVQYRLTQTAEVQISAHASLPEGAYACLEELLADVKLIETSLNSTGNRAIFESDVQAWVDQISVFGFHMARLDIRQDAGAYRVVMNELFKAIGADEDPASLDELARCALMTKTLGSKISIPLDSLSAQVTETLALFTLIRRTMRSFGTKALGSHVLSMTHVPSDVLTVLWLFQWSEQVDGGSEVDVDCHLPIVPLFETIGDLQHADETFAALLEQPAYREYLSLQNNQQTIMIGYSDSTKDGGYLSAQWSLNNAQVQLMQVAKNAGIELTFFHGRGGSLGRGGGPAAKSVLSLPSIAFNGVLRLTEQGEVLADRYDNAHIAHRHLEQLVWASLTAVSREGGPVASEWSDTLELLSSTSFEAYRRLVDHPSFAEYYRKVTPINAIEQLPIGSRPSKRKSGNRVEDLRAIPWVYSWTQCRCLLPAWYGLGSAFEKYVGDHLKTLEHLQQMHREWSFFRIAIDTAMLALAQANMPIFRYYAELGDAVEGGPELTEAILKEYERTRHAVLAITGCSELLDDIPWLQRSIHVRNGYVDPLNLLQVEMLRRRDAVPQDNPERFNAWEHLTHLTIKGVSTGMRTTG